MSFKDKIIKDFQAATKAGDKERRGTLSMLLAALKNAEIEKRTRLSGKSDIQELEKSGMLTDKEVIDVISRQVKQRKDSVEQFKAGRRLDLSEKEEKEIKILAQYLPQQMSEDEICLLVKSAISKTGAISVKDMGRVMAALMPSVKGKADGLLVSKIVKEELSK